MSRPPAPSSNACSATAGPVPSLLARVEALERENAVLRAALAHEGIPGPLLALLVDHEVCAGGRPDGAGLQAAASELLFMRAALEQAPDSTLFVDAQGRLVFANRAAARELGFTREELLTKRLFDIEPSITPERWPQVWNRLAQVRRSTCESTHRTKSGRLIPVESTVEFVEIGEKPILCLFARSLEERKRAEAALVASEGRFGAIVEASPMGIHMYRLEDDGRLVFTGANAAADAILGVNNGLFVGKTIEDAFPLLVDTQVPEQYRRVAETGVPWYAEQVLYEEQQLRGAYEVHAFRTGLRRMASMFLDITERRQLEARLRESEKLEALGLLAGGIAHGFNNQLTGVLGYAELIQQLSSEPEIKSLAERLMAAGTQASRLTTQLLAFARKGRYRSEAVDLHCVLDRAMDLFPRSADGPIVLVRRYDACPATALGDPVLLHSAFLNLATNASEAMPNGGQLQVETDMCTLEADEPRVAAGELARGRYVRVRFRDTGIGMSDDVLKRAFEPFFTTKERGRATGMGLPAVYGTVRSHGGAIAARSTPGKGALFEVLLPSHWPEELASTPDVTSVCARSRQVTRILLVDDELVIRQVTEKMLRGLGYDVVVCRDGREAVRVYRDQWRDLDLVILDMVMPNMDGGEAFRAMKRINPVIRAVLSSGHSVEGDAQQLLEQGMAAFLPKPFKLAELQLAVRAALGAAS